MKLVTIILTISLCAKNVLSLKNLDVFYEWKQLDFEFPSERARKDAIARGVFVPENNVPLGLEVYGDRLFITVPRWKKGVPASLTYIKMTDAPKSPKLRPYPNWAAHQPVTGPYAAPPEIVSPFRIKADKCGRLWVLDSGEDNISGSKHSEVVVPPQLLVYDLLNNDELLRRYVLPKDQVKEGSFFANIAVEDAVCDDAHAYLADLFSPQLVVYSWRKRKSWRVKHHYFNIDPLAGTFNISGVSFQWASGLFGLALSPPTSTGFSTLYFHPFTSTNEFSVSTRVLRDPNIAKKSFHEFKLLGSRGNRGESSASSVDPATGVLFYALPHLNAVGCWRTQEERYEEGNQGVVHVDEVTMGFPNDVKVDGNGRLWVLSDRLPEFLYSRLNGSDVNFRVLMARVEDAVRGTVCDAKGRNWGREGKRLDLSHGHAHNHVHDHQHKSGGGSKFLSWSCLYSSAVLVLLFNKY